MLDSEQFRDVAVKDAAIGQARAEAVRRQIFSRAASRTDDHGRTIAANHSSSSGRVRDISHAPWRTVVPWNHCLAHRKGPTPPESTCLS